MQLTDSAPVVAHGADSPQARVAGAGPILICSGGKLCGTELSLKTKHATGFAT